MTINPGAIVAQPTSTRLKACLTGLMGLADHTGLYRIRLRTAGLLLSGRKP